MRVPCESRNQSESDFGRKLLPTIFFPGCLNESPETVFSSNIGEMLKRPPNIDLANDIPYSSFCVTSLRPGNGIFHPSEQGSNLFVMGRLQQVEDQESDGSVA